MHWNIEGKRGTVKTMNKKVFFISTSIPYVNAAPHIGHALEFVEADAIARHWRLQGGDVFFLTGTDDNALKNVQAAESTGVQPQAWVDEHAKIFQELCHDLNISNDDFIRTSRDERHARGAQKLWSACDQKDIYKKKYSGLYCVGCEEFKKESDLERGECQEHPGKKVEIIEEDNYFFKLSKYGHELESLIESDALQIIPETRKNEILQFIRGGLEDFSISRSYARAKGWGVSVPGDATQMMYVWFDALSNYINALGYADNSAAFTKYWVKGDEVLHCIGKGITRFHGVYWPAMLLSAKIPLPKKIFVHGYLTVDGQKMSKTIGNVVDPRSVIKKFGVDALRHYLLRECSPFEDGDYSEAKLIGRYNADLANGLGNLVSRVTTIAAKHGLINLIIGEDIEQSVDQKIEEVRKKVREAMEKFQLNEATASIWELVAFADKYVNDKKPWAEKDNRKTVVNAIVVIDNIAALLTPFLPETAEKITSCINWKSKTSLEIKKTPVLFPRI